MLLHSSASLWVSPPNARDGGCLFCYRKLWMNSICLFSFGWLLFIFTKPKVWVLDIFNAIFPKLVLLTIIELRYDLFIWSGYLQNKYWLHKPSIRLIPVYLWLKLLGKESWDLVNSRNKLHRQFFHCWSLGSCLEIITSSFTSLALSSVMDFSSPFPFSTVYYRKSSSGPQTLHTQK